MGKKKKKKEEKKKFILYPLESVFAVKSLIKVYKRIAMGWKAEWICLCKYPEWLYKIFDDNKEMDSPFSQCDICPAYIDSCCEGPGGEWEPIEEYNDGKSFSFINHLDGEKWDKRKILDQAKKKAKAWEEWLEKQKQLWKLMGVNI
jgi:hypothetical protein